MKKSIFFKVFSGYLLVIVLLATLVLIFTFIVVRAHYIHTRSQELKNFNCALSPQVEHFVQNASLDSLEILIINTGKTTGTRITIIRANGVVIADSEKDPRSMENHGMRAEVKQALKDSTGISIRFSRTVKQDMLYVATPLKINNQIVGVIRSSLFLHDINTLLNNLILRILLVALLTIMLSILVAILYSRGLSKPIRELVQASRRVAKGDFDVNVIFRGSDELKEFADSFNHMVDQLRNLIDAQSREKEALNTIITSIREGVLVLDLKGKVILCNNSFLEIIDQKRVDGKYFWELILRPDFNELVDSIRKGKQSIFSAEVEIRGRFFICSAAYLSTAKQIVLTFHDITGIRETAIMKKDLVLNVSHELRTPLTAIKGFVETMETEHPAQNKRYLAIIKRHTNRLINIVEDLQMLSKLETTDTLELEEIDLSQIASSVVKMFEHTAQQKGIALSLKLDDPHPLLKGDAFKLEQLFINLIDNALKYTEEGSVMVRIDQKDKHVIIEIVDTGIGIPSDQIPRIFERFYVVDKSRSRKMGGTGLGLSIVKHIVQTHKGEITVHSEPDKGTSFMVKLPTNM